MNNPPTILIIGADGYGQVVADILLAQPCRPAGKMRPVGFIDDNSNRHNNHFAKLPTLGTLRDLALIPHDGVIVAVEHNQARQQLIERLLWQGEWLVTIIHPAAVIGTGLRAAGIRVDQVRSSEFNRAVETAETMSVGPVIVERDLTPLASYGALEPRLDQCLNRAPAPGTINVLVAHGHVTELFSHLNEGDGAVFRPGPNGPTFIGFIPYQTWQRLGRSR